MFFLKMAARNILRQRSRSMVVAITLVIASFAMIFGLAYGKAIEQKMMKDVIATFLGHVQLHRNTDRNLDELVLTDKTVLDTINNYDSIIDALRKDKSVKFVTPRMQIGALLRCKDKSTGTVIVGVDAAQEFRLSTHISVLEGRLLSEGEKGILITKKLKSKLGARVGEHITVSSSKKDGSIVEVKLLIRGVVSSTGRDTFVSHVSYVDIGSGQTLSGEGKKATDIVVLLKDIKQVDTFIAQWQPILVRRDIRLDSYKTLGVAYSGVAEAIALMVNGATSIVFLLILINIINIALMTVYERTREVGTLAALGASPHTILGLFVFEFIILGLFSTTVGAIVGGSFVQWLTKVGIPAQNESMVGIYGGQRLYLELNVDYILTAYVVVIIVCLVAALYPAYRAKKIEPVEALKEF